MQRKEQKEEGKEGNSLEKENVLLLSRRKRRTRPSVNYAKDWLGQLFQDGGQFGQLDWKNLKRKILDELEIAKEDVKDIVAILASTEENAEFTPRSKI